MLHLSSLVMSSQIYLDISYVVQSKTSHVNNSYTNLGVKEGKLTFDHRILVAV